MTTTKIAILCVIFGLGIVFLYLAFCKKKRTKHKSGKKSITNIPPEGEWINVDLKDNNDQKYTLPNEERTTLSNARTAVYRGTRAAINMHISQSWYDRIERLVDNAYTIYRNANAPRFTPSESRFMYFRNLYYRSVKAGKLLEEADNEIGNKVLALHRIRFDSISSDERRQIMELQKSLPKLQSLISEEKHNVWNNTHSLKLLVSKCGRSGYNWYVNLVNNQRRKYGK